MRKAHLVSTFTWYQEHMGRFERNELRHDSKMIVSGSDAEQNWTFKDAAGSIRVQATEAAGLWIGLQVWQASRFQQWSGGPELPQFVELDDQPRVRPARLLAGYRKRVSGVNVGSKELFTTICLAHAQPQTSAIGPDQLLLNEPLFDGPG